MSTFFKTIMMATMIILATNNAHGQMDANGNFYFSANKDYKIGVLNVGDATHLNTVISTQVGWLLPNISPFVELYIHITWIHGDTLKGSVRYKVRNSGLLYGNGLAEYQWDSTGKQTVGFIAVKMGTSFLFDFTGSIKFFTDESQNYNFATFSGLYEQHWGNGFWDGNKQEWIQLSLDKTSGQSAQGATDRNLSIELNMLRNTFVASVQN